MGHPKGTYRSFFQEKNSRWVREGKDFAGQQIPYQQTVGDTASHSKSRIIESLFREAEIQRLPCPSPICQLSPNSALNLYGNFLFSKFSKKKKKERDYTSFPTPFFPRESITESHVLIWQQTVKIKPKWSSFSLTQASVVLQVT